MMMPEAVQRYPPGLYLAAAGGGLLLLLTALVVWLSLQARPAGLFRFQESTSLHLPEGVAIAGTAEFGKDSYLVGEAIDYRLRVRYRADVIRPELDSFQRSISFLPFDLLDMEDQQVRLDDGISEYRLEYRLQGVRAVPRQSYRFDPAVMYYTAEDDPGDNLRSLRIQPPPLHIAAYYPADIVSIPLQPLRGGIATRTPLRRGLLAVSAGGLLGLALCLPVWFGRRRSAAELSAEERLWRGLHEVTPGEGPRAELLHCERVLMQLLQQRAGLGPEAFWSGVEPEDPDWRSLCARGRELLQQGYRSAGPDAGAVSELRISLDEILRLLVQEERLWREREPGFAARLRRSPAVVAASAGLAVVSLALLVLAARPQWWLSPELTQYNRSLSAVPQEAHPAEEAYLNLVALGDSVRDRRVKAAAYYNAGTLRARQGFLVGESNHRDWILPLVFGDVTVEEMMHRLLEGPFTEEMEVVSALANAAEQLRRAGLELQEAVRVEPQAEDIRRNLELVIKQRAALLTRLVQLRQFYREQQEGEEEARSLEGIVNLLESELPEEYDESVRRNDRGYMILERF